MSRTRSLKQRFDQFLKTLEKYTDRSWYPALLGFLSGIDLLVVVIPTDALLVTSILLQPKKWISFALGTAAGSVIGSSLLALALTEWGTGLAERLIPGFSTSHAWSQVSDAIAHWGFPALIALAASPLAMQPTVILASLGGMGVLSITFGVAIGRTAKFLFLGYLSAKMPAVIRKLPWLQSQVKEINETH